MLVSDSIKTFDHFRSKIHTEKSFRNLINSNWNQTVFTIFRMIQNQTDVRLVPNRSVNGYYNMITVWYNKISKLFLCGYDQINFHREKLNPKYFTFVKLVIAVLVYLTDLHRYLDKQIFVLIQLKICKFTSIWMAALNVSFLDNRCVVSFTRLSELVKNYTLSFEFDSNHL